MSAFSTAYDQLNDAQRQAVDTIDGPLLVIAGPGTGKTQLLSARVANILYKTDTLPHNILCLTFTENGAENMRERLGRFIGKTAYDVTISTYHAFGSDIINRFPEYFTGLRLENPIDELGKHQILSELVAEMSYKNPLKQTQHHLGDLIATISEVKRALLTSKDLAAIARQNQEYIAAVSPLIAAIFADVNKMPGSYVKAAPYYEKVHQALVSKAPIQLAHSRFGSLANFAIDELTSALAAAGDLQKSTPLTGWKNSWLAKNVDNQFCLAGALENQRLAALAPVLTNYQAALHAQGLYDFDDMIIKATEVLADNDDLKYSLQEQYLYILLDEFQDTNGAQARLVQLLSDNPVHEGRPNIMAVGDDDQAIYAFQGAQYSNMLDFYNGYRDVRVINLTENYRSQAPILQTAELVAEQIEHRLIENFDGMTKRLVPAGKSDTVQLERISCTSDITQYDAMADQIANLVASGTAPKDIAVLAPKHRQLEPLVPYLNKRGIAVSYEKRENILEAPVIRQLLTMCQLVRALHANNIQQANALWPEVLSYDFWRIPNTTIWQLSWQVTDSHGQLSWSQAALSEPATRTAALVLLSSALRFTTETAETMLDYLIGNEVIDTHETDNPSVSSPLRDYYLGNAGMDNESELFYDTLSHLTVLRAKLRAWQRSRNHHLRLEDMLSFIDGHEAAGQQMTNTSPHVQSDQAVQLMTVFKAKGLEFDHVFLASCQNDVWGSSARGNANKLTLPKNIAVIRHAGATDDERLRIVYVAITRARRGLHMYSYTSDYAGKANQRLKYFDEQLQPDGHVLALTLPENYQLVRQIDQDVPQLAVLQLDWRSRHKDNQEISKLSALLSERLRTYQLSPTHLTTFIDLEYGGPQSFFMRTLLRFPEAPTLDSEFGNTIHETLEWVQHQLTTQQTLPTGDAVMKEFNDRLSRKHLLDSQQKLLAERGEHALSAYIGARGTAFHTDHIAEKNFKHENVFLDNVHMSGKIDRLEIDTKNKTIVVVDYKTGKSHSRWTSEAKLHRYQLQLYCYKLLVEHSRSYAGYTVTSGRLEFVEPDENGQIHSLELTFTAEELARTEQLLKSLWGHVTNLNFPDVTQYAANLTGMRAFESDLINGAV